MKTLTLVSPNADECLNQVRALSEHTAEKRKLFTVPPASEAKPRGKVFHPWEPHRRFALAEALDRSVIAKELTWARAKEHYPTCLPFAAGQATFTR